MEVGYNRRWSGTHVPLDPPGEMDLARLVSGLKMK